MITSFLFGTRGIRTHDQGIMSPLRYRCAIVPQQIFVLSFNFEGLFTVVALLSSQNVPFEIQSMSC